MTFFDKTNNYDKTDSVDNIIWLTKQLDSIKLPKSFCLAVVIGFLVLVG